MKKLFGTPDSSPKFLKSRKLFYRLPGIIVIAAAGYLLIMLFLSYFIDLQGYNLWGIRDWLAVNHGYEVPLFWLHFFSEASLTELLQWLMMGLSVLVGAIYILLSFRTTSKFPWAWFLLVIGIYIMLWEDAANLRHSASEMFGSSVLGVDTATMEWRTGIWRTAIEMGFFLILGLLLVVALYFLIKDRRLNLPGKRYMLAGYFFYGIAVAGSATRNIGDWYARVGERLLDIITRGAEVSWSGSCVVYGRDPLGFWFMDFVMEESLELMGAAFLLAALTSTLISLKLENKKGKIRPK